MPLAFHSRDVHRERVTVSHEELSTIAVEI
jgi:hypothetical protein